MTDNKTTYTLTRRKDADKVTFKPKFVERFSELTDWDEFEKYSLSYLRKCVRVNTIKDTISDVKKSIEAQGIKLVQVPWCKEGFWADCERTDLGNLFEHAMGKIYVQEAASMIPPVVLDPQPGERVLDMCAAPGSKTTQIAAMMKNNGVLIANDVSFQRLAALGINLQRCGVHNCIITQMKGHQFKNIEFDRILVDAPCSGIGTIRKSMGTVRMWNPAYASHMAKTQKRLIETAYEMLKVGGTLVYSTCTTEPEENEGIIDYLLGKYSDATVEDINLDIKRSPAVMSFGGTDYNPSVSKCLRLWPQDNDTEGFFVCRIKKNDNNNS